MPTNDILFSQLDLLPEIQKSLTKQGYEKPTPIQSQAIPFILEGQDLVACAQTGTGKTAAFSIPMLQILHKLGEPKKKDRALKALILTPTRELAIQIEENIRDYGQNLGLKHAVIFGGVSQHNQTEILKKGVDILVATPGRLLDLMQQGFINLKQLSIFILDEADRMLDMGFIHDVKRVMSKLPERRQTLLFSATMPTEIQKLAQSFLSNPKYIEVSPQSTTAETVQQFIYFVDKPDKKKLLAHLIEEKKWESVLVFTRTKHGADRIVKELARKKIFSAAIHGDKSQNARQRALSDFKDKKIKVLVATDLASRGIDIDNLTYMVNYDLPNVPETYVHRIGRTGRAGGEGYAFSFCDGEENEYLIDIQKLIKKTLPIVEDHPYPLSWQKMQANNKVERKPQQNSKGPKTGKPNNFKKKFARKY